MFVYDSKNDEYSEIFLDSSSSSSIATSRRSSTSSNLSIKSTASNVATRIISKTGRVNITSVKIANKHIAYFYDLGNTLLNIRWRWILLTLFLVNFVSFFIFGIMWMWMAFISGDFEENAVDFCVVNTKNLTGYILLSMETMLTIGYGFRYPTEHCKQGWIISFLQALVGIGIQGALVSVVYVKVAKPFTKNTLGIFSKKAVISLRDGQLCFIIRIIDVVGKVSIGTNIKMYFIDKDNEDDPYHMQQMIVEPFGFLIFPLEIIHVIDSKSPLWNLNPYFLLVKRIEIIVVAEGSSVITSQPSQIRMSYRSSNILWGHRFASCVTFNSKKEKYVINYKKFNEITPYDTPLCSAEELLAIQSICKEEEEEFEKEGHF